MYGKSASRWASGRQPDGRRQGRMRAGVMLDRSGNIVTNLHVAGNAKPGLSEWCGRWPAGDD